MTAQAFERLLTRLGSDVEAGGREYDALRRKLVLFFAMRRAAGAEALADETLDRVARRLDEGERVEQMRAYVFGVARRVLQEDAKQRARELSFVDGLGGKTPADDGETDMVEARAHCLQRCLQALSDEHRALIVGYYEGAGITYLKERKRLAAHLGLSYVALKTQAHRLRTRLEVCTLGCLQGPTGLVADRPTLLAARADAVTDRPRRPR